MRVPRNGPPHRLRSAFERALRDDDLVRMPVVWWLYMCVEIRCGQKDMARRVFFRAIQTCAWSKSIWMECMRSLQETMRRDDLQEVCDMMEEKQLGVWTVVQEGA